MPARKDVAAEGHHLLENARVTHLFKGPNTATTLWRRVELESRANWSQWTASLTFSVADSAQALTHSWGFALEIHMATGPHLTTAKDFSFPHKEEFPFCSKSFMIKIFKTQLATIQAMKIFDTLKNWDMETAERIINFRIRIMQRRNGFKSRSSYFKKLHIFVTSHNKYEQQNLSSE